jgi:U3 small nucleolar RNA-associated protein 21
MRINQSSKPLALAFSKSALALLASSDENGNINIWDLNEQKIHSRILNAHNGYISYLEFVENSELLLSGSAADNSLKQWVYDENEGSKFRILRMRSGCAANIKKLRFYGDQALHIVASTDAAGCEIIDFSVINEAMSLKLSHVSI